MGRSKNKSKAAVVSANETAQTKEMDATEGMQFGKMLASPDKRVRDRTVKNLTKWIRSSELASGSFSSLEMLKVWKALFYCMWYSDKTPVQQELAQTLAEFVHVFRNTENSLLFLSSFFETIQREWQGIDQFRVEKYYSLIRKVIHESFVWLLKSEWEQEKVDGFGTMLESVVFGCKEARGVRNQVLDVYLTELCKVGGKVMQMETIQELLVPCYSILLNTFHSDTLFSHAIKEVFKPLQENQFVDPTVRVASDKVENVSDSFSLPPQPVGGFDYLDFAQVAQSLFEIAADGELVKDSQRAKLYDLSKEFKRAAKLLAAENEKKQKEKSRKSQSDGKERTPKRRKTESTSKSASTTPSPKSKSSKKAKSGAEKKHGKSANVSSPVEDKSSSQNSTPVKKAAVEVEEDQVMTTPSQKKKKKKSKSSKKGSDKKSPRSDSITESMEVEEAPSTPVPSTPRPAESVKKSVSFALHKNQVSQIKKITKKMKRTPYKRPDTTPPSVLKRTRTIPPVPMSEPKKSTKARRDSDTSSKGSKSARKAKKKRDRV